MDIKMIAVDLDRTLLHTDKTISLYTASVLKECRKRGLKVMVATARPLRAIEQYCELVDFDAVVVSNGARIICGNQKTEYAICQESTKNILTVLQEHSDIRITLETGDRAYSNRFIEEYETVLSDDLIVPAEKEGALKILVHIDDEKTMEVVTNAITEDLYYTISNKKLLQMMNKSATKWNGIKTILCAEQCLPEETAYFGDDYDDIEALKLCGMGIAVSNGIKEAKNAAGYVTESNDEDGVAKFIERFILSSKK